MAVLSPQLAATTGTALTYTAADPAGDQAPVGAGLLLLIRNESAAEVTVTLVSPGTFRGLAIADAALPIPAGADGAFPLGTVFRDPTSGQAAIAYSDATSVTVAVVRAG